MDRRGFLRLFGGVAATMVAPSALAAAYGDVDTSLPIPAARVTQPPLAAEPAPLVPSVPLIGDRTISLYHPGSGESFTGTYWRDGAYLPDAMERLTWLMRDRVRGQRLHQIDPALFDFIRDVAEHVGERDPVHLISGYRAGVPRTRRASKDSRHLEGKAVDIRLPGFNLGRVGRQAIAMQRGGVGLYRSSHLHLDTGPVRTWGRG